MGGLICAGLEGSGAIWHRPNGWRHFGLLESTHCDNGSGWVCNAYGLACFLPPIFGLNWLPPRSAAPATWDHQPVALTLIPTVRFIP